MGLNKATTYSNAGFTLVEMAIVMVIIGLVMLTVFPALNAVRTANERSLTQNNLHSLMLATAAYVQASGCLPCPASAGVVGVNFGKVGTTNNVACGACSGTAAEGIPPFASLGIPSTTAHDGWGHWITMRVDTALTSIPTSATSVFVPPWAPCNATDVTNGFCTSAQLTYADKGICKVATATSSSSISGIGISNGTNGATISQYAAVIFVSHGSTGYGSYFAQAIPAINNGTVLSFPSNYTSCASGSYAMCNEAGGGSTFYDMPSIVSSTNPYDDILLYANRNTLVSMLGNPSCNTVW